MTHYQILPLTDDFIFELHAEPNNIALSPGLIGEIEAVWAKEQQKQPKIFNGKILSALTLENNRLTGAFVDYKIYVAQMRRPDLYPFLKVNPVTISGITISGDYILMGQRSENVLYPLYHELAPSGGLDPNSLINNKIDVRKQFELELHEETGIAPMQVRWIEPFALIIDPKTHTHEICAKISLDSTPLPDLHYPNQEYQNLVWVPQNHLPHFIANHHPDNFIELSLFLIQKFVLE